MHPQRPENWLIGPARRLRWGRVILSAVARIAIISAGGALISLLVGWPWYQGALMCSVTTVTYALIVPRAARVGSRLGRRKQ